MSTPAAAHWVAAFALMGPVLRFASSESAFGETAEGRLDHGVPGQWPDHSRKSGRYCGQRRRPRRNSSFGAAQRLDMVTMATRQNTA